MDENIDPQDHETVERLRAFGRRPVDPATASAHLTAMAGAVPGRSPRRTKVAVAGAFLAGLLVGGTGLATAGALPDPAQEVAFNVLHRTGLNVPHPHAGDPCKGPPPWALERRAPEAGEAEEHERVRREDCPRRGEGKGGPPAHAGRGGPEGSPGNGRGQGRGGHPAADPCRGKPSWAGPPAWRGQDREPTSDELAARDGARRAWREQCGRGGPEGAGAEGERTQGGPADGAGSEQESEPGAELDRQSELEQQSEQESEPGVELDQPSEQGVDGPVDTDDPDEGLDAEGE